MFLATVFIGLCFSSIAICRNAETQLKNFLENNSAIDSEKSLNDYRSVVSACMYMTLAQIAIICVALCLIAVLIWIKGISGALSVPLLGITLGFGKEVGKLEDKARMLTSTTPDLDRRYQEISEVWRKKALPNF